MKRKIVFVGLVMLATIMIVGCGSGEKNEKGIVEDINESEYLGTADAIDKNTASSFKITKRNTKKKEIDEVYGTLIYSNSKCEITEDIELIYNYYSTGGWILDDFIPQGNASFVALSGVDDIVASADFGQYGFEQTGDTVFTHETDLEKQIDKVTMDISREGSVFSEEGTATAGYSFKDGEWMLDYLSKDNNYKLTWNLSGTWIGVDKNQDQDVIVYFDDSKEKTGMEIPLNIGYIACGSYTVHTIEDHVNDTVIATPDEYEVGKYVVSDTCAESSINSYKLLKFGRDSFTMILSSSERTMEKISDDYISASQYYEDNLSTQYKIDKYTNIVTIDSQRKTSEINEDTEIISAISKDEKVFPIMIIGYDDGTYPCAVMVQDVTGDNEALVYGTYDEMVSSCVNREGVMFATPVLFDGAIYTATKWDAFDEQWYDGLLSYDEFIEEVNRLAEISE